MSSKAPRPEMSLEAHEHSAEPWRECRSAGDHQGLVSDANGDTVAVTYRGKADAPRIVSTVNACAGLSLPTDVPEGALLAVVEAASAALTRGDRDGQLPAEFRDDLAAALAAIGRKP